MFKKFIKIRNYIYLKLYRILISFEKFRNNGFALDILSSDFIKNPYSSYSTMRSNKPIYYSAPTFLYWVTNMEYVQEMLRDKKFSVDDRKYPIAKRRRKELIKDGREIMLDQFDNPSILKLDPPDHSRIRKLVSYGFTNKYISSLELEIKETINDCLDKTHNKDSFDLIDTIAKPLPAIVIAKMMGLPKEDLNQFQSWSEDLLQEVGGISSTAVQKNKQEMPMKN